MAFGIRGVETPDGSMAHLNSKKALPDRLGLTFFQFSMVGCAKLVPYGDAVQRRVARHGSAE